MGGFQSHYGKTLLHPVGLIAVLLLGMAVLLLPRRYAVFPMIILASFIPSAQRLVVMSLDFNLLRILILFGWARLILRREYAGIVWNRLDSLVIAWMLSGTFIYTIQNGTQGAFINRCGWMFDGFGMYFYFRCVLRDWSDLDRLVVGFMIVSLAVAVAFAVEASTRRNIFSVFGGVPEITNVRDGRLRCQGAFSHAILAGCFWASTIPWMLAYVAQGRKILGGAGIVACLAIVVFCSSSTPVMAVVLVAVGMAIYPLRLYLRPIRWSFFLLLLLLHFIMNAPVWHLISRVDFVGGSTGWHRFKLMDTTIKNFSEWWLLGENDPMSWGVINMIDITNQYILEALLGGLLTLLLFISVIVTAFGFVGRGLVFFETDPNRRIVVYAIGASLFVHVWIYFSVSYFGQIIMIWYLNLALAGAMHQMICGEASSSGSRDGQVGLPIGGKYKISNCL